MQNKLIIYPLHNISAIFNGLDNFHFYLNVILSGCKITQLFLHTEETLLSKVSDF